MFLTPEEELPFPALTEGPIPMDYLFPNWALFSPNPLPGDSMGLQWHIWTIHLPMGGNPFGIQLEDWFSKDRDAAGRESQILTDLFPGFYRIKMGISFVKQGKSRIFWEESRDSTELIPKTSELMSPALSDTHVLKGTLPGLMAWCWTPHLFFLFMAVSKSLTLPL